MAQFDVFRNVNPRTSTDMPFLFDVQSDLLDGLATRVVIPLISAERAGRTAEHLNPRFAIEGRSVIPSTAELAGIPSRTLGAKVGSLQEQRDKIVAHSISCSRESDVTYTHSG